MRLSEFQTLMADEFGSEYAAVLLRDLVLTELGDLTGQGALEAGLEPKEIWQAICKAQRPKRALAWTEQKAEKWTRRIDFCS